MGFFANEKANLEQDIKAGYAYLEKNWKRILGWYLAYYVAHHMGPVAASKAQAVLNLFGM